jgi:hypothetical protein
VLLPPARAVGSRGGDRVRLASEKLLDCLQKLGLPGGDEQDHRIPLALDAIMDLDAAGDEGVVLRANGSGK